LVKVIKHGFQVYFECTFYDFDAGARDGEITVCDKFDARETARARI